METTRAPLPVPRGFESLAVLDVAPQATVHRAVRSGEILTLVVSRGGDADSDARFRAEVHRLAAACAGPGVLGVREVAIDAGLGVRAIVLPPFGPQLGVEPRPLLDALALLDPLARALGRAHAHGFGHGALSPRHVALHEGVAYVVDLVPAALSPFVPEPEWATPEQLDARAIDVARADVYALASLFAHVVSGRSPQGDESSLSLYARVTDREHRPTLSALGVPAAAGIDRVLERALAVDPELRFAHADAFWDALRTAVFAAPVATPELPRPKPVTPSAPPKARPPRAPMPLVIGISTAIVVVGLGAEAIVRMIRRPRVETAIVAPPPPPPPVVSASASVVASAAPVASTSKEPVELPPMVPVPAESPSFFVDRTEVTVASYRTCVKAGACAETWKHASAYDENDPVRREWRCNYHRKDRDDHPINCITFAQANAYCTWAGKRLPTGAEWTRAARGDDARRYPWGDTMPRCKEAVFARYGPDNPGCNKQPVGTAKADAHPKTASPFGALDMAGSLWEWTTERSSRGFPFLRGGAWDSPETGITVEARLEQSPGNGDVTLGFRCVKDP